MTVTDLASMGEALDAVGLPVVIKPAVSWVDGGATAWRAAPTLARTREDAIENVTMLLEGALERCSSGGSRAPARRSRFCLPTG